MLKKIIAALVLLCSCVLLVPSFESKASAFSVNYAEPSVGDNQGYLIIEFIDSSGNTLINTWFWNASLVDEYGQSLNSCIYLVVKPQQLTISVNAPSNVDCTGDWCVGAYWNSGALSVPHSKTFTNYDDYIYSYSGYTIKGFTFKGNVTYVENYVSNNTTPSITFSKLDSASQLQSIISILLELSSKDSTIISKLTEIVNSNESIKNKIQALNDLVLNVSNNVSAIKNYILKYYPEYAEQLGITNTWLEKIFNYLNESQEQQKQEAQTQGSSSVSQGSSAIEDKGGDFAGSLSGLTNSMSYTGTDCSWTFPTVKLPAIPGVMDEVTLIESQPIDFSFWINAIPSGIMLIIQSVLTIGLIVYCFKELYSTISYVLTLRKDDNS